MTLIVCPEISTEKEDIALKTITVEGEKVVVHTPYKIFDDGCERIIRNGNILADYYQKRNCIILYFNPFPYEPRIRKFQKFISLIDVKLKKFDNTRMLEQAVFAQNALAFAENIKKAYNKKVDENETLHNSIQSRSREIISHYHTIRTNLQLISTYEKYVKNFNSLFLKRYSEIKELPFIKKAILKEKGLEVDFDDIYIKHKALTYYIGKFKCLIKPDSINFENYDNKIKDKRCSDVKLHPHISEGRACFGNISREINELLSALEFKKLIFLISQHLKSYGSGNPYFEIENWPVVE